MTNDMNCMVMASMSDSFTFHEAWHVSSVEMIMCVTYMRSVSHSMYRFQNQNDVL